MTRWLAPSEKLFCQILQSEVGLFVTIIYKKLSATVTKISNLGYLMVKWWVNEIKLRSFYFKSNWKVLFANICEEDWHIIFPRFTDGFK